MGARVSQGKEVTQAGKKEQIEGKTQLQLGLQRAFRLGLPHTIQPKHRSPLRFPDIYQFLGIRSGYPYFKCCRGALCRERSFRHSCFCEGQRIALTELQLYQRSYGKLRYQALTVTTPRILQTSLQKTRWKKSSVI